MKRISQGLLYMQAVSQSYRRAVWMLAEDVIFSSYSVTNVTGLLFLDFWKYFQNLSGFNPKLKKLPCSGSKSKLWVKSKVEDEAENKQHK